MPLYIKTYHFILKYHSIYQYMPFYIEIYNYISFYNDIFQNIALYINLYLYIILYSKKALWGRVLFVLIKNGYRKQTGYY